MTAVGDPFQAIYGWRGAAASNILTFADDFPRTDGRPAHRFALTVNRRSGRTILDVANVLSRPLRTETGSVIADGTAPADHGVAGLGLLRAPEGTLFRSGAGRDLRNLAGGDQLDRGPDRRRCGQAVRCRVGPTWRC